MTLRLHYNENTAGCSPAVVRALAALTIHDIATYADDEATAADLGDWFGVPADWVLPVNGLDEGILLAALLAAQPVEQPVDRPTRFVSRSPYQALIVEPAFEMYVDAVTATGGVPVHVPPAPDLFFSVEDTLARATGDTRVVFLSDPNNPTGLGIPRDDIGALAAAMPNTMVFVDEAYADFSRRTLIDSWLSDRPNVVVGRTFSKAHGLAGLRIGALVAAPATIARLRRIALPYRINVAAAAALRAALADRDHLADAIASADASRELLAAACARLGFPTWPSEANFLLVRVGPNAADCAAFMEGRGVRVRDRSSLPGCDGCIRITTGPISHTQLAISRLEAWHATQCR